MIDDHFTMPDLLPDAVLVTGPVGSGKTETAIEEVLEVQYFRPFSTIWVLLATGQQASAFRERLLARSEDAVQFGVEFFDFYRLYGRILDLAGNPQQQVDDTARYQILHHVAEKLLAHHKLEHFTPIAQMPGFIGLAAVLINELKQGLVRPEEFARVAYARGPKDRDLARLYAGYQEFLQARRLVDRHGAGWLALEHLEHNPRLAKHVHLLIVDGFDQFNQVHVRLLDALARQAGRTVLTLTQAPDALGRRFRRFDQTRERLVALDRKLWRVQTVDRVPAGERPAALADLVAGIFQSQPHPVPGDGSIGLIEAPDVPHEVQAVLRRVKRLLLAGTPPESIVVIARRMDRYSAALRETALAYGLPLVVREGVPLRENPAVAALLDLLDLHGWGFPRREVMDALHSPYFAAPDLSAEQIALLERISRRRQVVRDRAAWRAAVESAAVLGDEDESEDAAAVDPAVATALGEALLRHFNRITPPPRATAFDYVRWIAGLIGPDPELDAAAAAEGDTSGGAPEESQLPDLPDEPPPADHFGVIGGVRAAADPAQVTRDLLALGELRRVLDGIRAAHDLLAGQGSPAALPWADFRAELELAVERATIPPPGGCSRLGRVLATDVLEVRGLPHDHVLVLGLAEGIFPQQEAEDALYQSTEREELAAAGIDLQTVMERSDELSLFYQAIGLARRSLTLSRFTVDDKGMPCPASPYWKAVRDVIEIPDEAVERVRIGAAPRLDDAATLGEAALAVAAIFSGEAGEGENLPAAGVYNALLDHAAWGACWSNVLRERAVEARRESALHPFDGYSGRLLQRELVAEAARLLGPQRTWSASQLNDYATCPFKFFARRVLHLEELKEPEEGMDVLQRGLVIHAVLEAAYRRISGAGLALIPDNLPRAAALLREEAAGVFAAAPERFGFRPSPVWEQECGAMLRQLEQLIALDFSPDSPAARDLAGERVPYWLEASFGFHGEPPLELDGEAGPLRVRGKIDRLDRVGDRLVVMDYKTTSTRYSRDDMAEGRDFQMLIYLLAARQWAAARGDLEVDGGFFWHVSSGEASGSVSLHDEAVEAAQAHLHHQVRAARAGVFVTRPSKTQAGRCGVRCDYGALCRFSRGALGKPLEDGE